MTLEHRAAFLPARGPDHARFVGFQRPPHPETSFGLDTGHATLSLWLGSSGPDWKQERRAGKGKEAGGECGEGERCRWCTRHVGGAHGMWVVHTACGGRTEEVMEGPGKAPEGVLPGEESGENFRQKANCGVRGSSQDIGGGDEVGALSRHREYSIADAKGHRECTLGKPLPQANFPASLNLCTHCLIVGQLD